MAKLDRLAEKQRDFSGPLDAQNSENEEDNGEPAEE
jgi:hypothetical protein